MTLMPYRLFFLAAFCDVSVRHKYRYAANGNCIKEHLRMRLTFISAKQDMGYV